jgi:site-specific DNA-cytosine methylase
MSWDDAAKTITGSARFDNGTFAVADPRKPPERLPLIVAADGTWHRPLTTLELAALQGFPTIIDGKPLVLSGSSQSAWRERIGNAVPPPTAQAIAEQMLVTLAQADLEAFTLSTSGAVWVEPAESTAVA